MIIWIILYTTMKVKRSHFITICLVILLLCDDVALPRRRARKHRMHRSHRSKRRGRLRRRCQVTQLEISLTYPKCRGTKIKTFGCQGRCPSETTISYETRIIVPKCTCCRPVKDKAFYTYITCAGNKNVLRKVKLLAARSCHCQPCGNCVMQFFPQIT